MWKTLFDHPGPFLVTAGHRTPDYLPQRKWERCSCSVWFMVVAITETTGDPQISLFCSTSLSLTLQCPWIYSDLSEGALNLFSQLKGHNESWGRCHSYSLAFLHLQMVTARLTTEEPTSSIPVDRKPSPLVYPHVSKHTHLLSGPDCHRICPSAKRARVIAGSWEVPGLRAGAGSGRIAWFHFAQPRTMVAVLDFSSWPSQHFWAPYVALNWTRNRTVHVSVGSVCTGVGLHFILYYRELP